MKLLSVVGARPQFVKAAVVSRAVAAHNQRGDGPQVDEVLVHTGQHYDDSMSAVFFKELDIRQPDHNLEIAGGGHGVMTGRMLGALEPLLQDEQPDCVLVHGDTNSTLAGALAATKLHIPVAHVESGLRSFNRRMPEEINRIVADSVGDLLFAPTEVAVQNLMAEGVAADTIIQSGDVMLDATLYYRQRSRTTSTVVADMNLTATAFVLATIHRAENTDDVVRLSAIVKGLCGVAEDRPVVLPLHPRTAGALQRERLLRPLAERVRVIDPVGYLDMLALEDGAAVIATDSGGVQKEAYFVGTPCVTLRDETEWTELVDAGANRLVAADADAIVGTVAESVGATWDDGELYGDGQAGRLIVYTLIERNTTWHA